MIVHRVQRDRLALVKERLILGALVLRSDMDAGPRSSLGPLAALVGGRRLVAVVGRSPVGRTSTE